MKEWFVVQTKFKQEKVALSVLTEQQVQVYQPFMRKYVFHARKKTMKEFPLFPSYIFVHVDPEDTVFNAVLWSRGVKKILQDNYHPVSIDKTFVEGLQSLEAVDGTIVKPLDFRPGEKVRVSSGAMKDVYGIIEFFDSEADRIRLLVNMVNSQARITLHPSMIEKT
ncbi:MAG: transcription termination/antitermination NusG family protein [Thermodesulfobacteriota bacterium]|nr:transcription termination/antitermination NusG family protein [Thermodesulfobacteriota bacterium]